MSHPVIVGLVPVVILIAIGFIAGRAGFMPASSTKDLSKLVFTIFLPPLLFRTMVNMQPENLQGKPLLAYLLAMALMYAVMFFAAGRNRRAAVLGLAASYSNTVMIGIALIQFAYGDQGVAVLLALVAVHSLIMLSLATVVLELVTLKEKSGKQGHPIQIMAASIWNTIKQPMIFPIIFGLLYAQTDWGIPTVIDKPLQLLANAFSPLAVILVGITLAATRVGEHLRTALALSFLKNLAHPVAVAAIGLTLGLQGLPLAVMIVTASLPIGANVFLFAQRYETALPEVTAAVAVSSVVALISVAMALSLARFV
ncbi:AEC family transporter [Variovorax sp. PCZ-1]|uniref:AEC family transporter n=1 Tax=Variovorax sp. PCZ-1 TaxID=2835533 RepID=UPI001BD14815|nr:AEC family transporter [Variovorax sp. PCZ-1]MBS7808349.1 AEC family transporter [Variovorax sp. PCZ-1]